MSYPTSVVPFHGDSLITLDEEGNKVVALKPIVLALGLDWKSQHYKIQESQRYGDITIPCQTPGGIQEMLCLPLKKLNGWLFSINPNKVRPDLKEKVIQYQEECFEVLYRYWNGEAISRQAQHQTPYDLVDSQKLKTLQSQSKALGWDYLKSLGIEKPADSLLAEPATARYSYRHQPYDLSKLAAELRPIAREYDKNHFWVHVHELNCRLNHQRKPTLYKLLDDGLLLPEHVGGGGNLRYTRKVNTLVARQNFNGQRKRVYVINWKLLDQENRV